MLRITCNGVQTEVVSVSIHEAIGRIYLIVKDGDKHLNAIYPDEVTVTLENEYTRIRLQTELLTN